MKPTGLITVAEPVVCPALEYGNAADLGRKRQDGE